MHHCSIQSQMFNQINVHLNPAKQARSNLNDDFAYLYPKRVTFMYDVVHLIQCRYIYWIIYTCNAMPSVSKHSVALLTLELAAMYNNVYHFVMIS
jgi:hypothetical protein